MLLQSAQTNSYSKVLLQAYTHLYSSLLEQCSSNILLPGAVLSSAESKLFLTLRPLVGNHHHQLSILLQHKQTTFALTRGFARMYPEVLTQSGIMVKINWG